MTPSSTTARKTWAEIAFQWFPFRHDKDVRGNHARAMIQSMIKHGKAWRKWKTEFKN
jgi:hypothetical protein